MRPSEFHDEENIRTRVTTRLAALEKLALHLGTFALFALPASLLDQLPNGKFKHAVACMKNADHEAGHALIALLGRKPIYEVCVSRFPGNLGKLLRWPGGFVVITDEEGVYKKPRFVEARNSNVGIAVEELVTGEHQEASEPEYKLSGEIDDLVYEIILSLNGLAAEVSMGLIDKEKNLGRLSSVPDSFNGPSDISKTFRRIVNLAETHKLYRLATESFSVAVAQDIFCQLVAFLSQNPTRKILRTLSDYFLETCRVPGEGDLTGQIASVLLHRGVTARDFDTMKEHYMALKKNIKRTLENPNVTL